MTMTSTQWTQLDSLFHACVDLDSDDRESYLDQHCPDFELREQVAQLLRHDAYHKNTLREKISSQAVDLLSTVKIGETLGAYTIDAELGEGGMGTVYLASRSDDSFDKQVAIKILHNKLASESDKDRFRSERQVLANMEHANIARLLDGGTCSDGSPYLVMEYVEGESIDQYCRREQLPLKKRIDLIIQVCQAIQYAHRHQVLHCDLKPSNIIVRRDNVAKLVDFGISQPLNLRQSNNSIDRSPMTPVYASPEQLEGRELDGRSDVYALAIVLHEILTGCRPDDNESSKGEFPDHQRIKLDRDILAILGRALEKDKTKRYQSIGELVDDLENYLRHRPVSARKQAFSYRLYKFGQRNPVSLSVALLFIVFSYPLFYFYHFIDQLPDHEVEEIIKIHAAPPSDDNAIKIAVMPFVSDENELLARQLTESLTHDLSKINRFHIIADNTIRRMNPSDIEFDRLKQDLDIDYFIQGKIKLDRNAINIDLSIFDVLNHSQIWQTADSRPLTDLNSLQKKLSTRVVESFKLTLSRKEQQLIANRYTASQAAYQYFSQGLYHYGQRFPEANRMARDNIEKAIAIDPDFARAHAVLANTHRIDFVNRWSEDPDASLQLANRFIKKALALDADLAQAHFVNGLIYRDQKLHDEAMASAASAISLNPSYADAFILLASVMCYADMPANSVALIRKAIRLNPDHPVNYKFHLGQCQYVSGQVDQAIETFEEAIERNPTAQRTNIWLTASYAKAGRIEEAEWIVDELLGWNPALTVAHIEMVTPFKHENDSRDFRKQLLLAGIPE